MKSMSFVVNSARKVNHQTSIITQNSQTTFLYSQVFQTPIFLVTFFSRQEIFLGIKAFHIVTNIFQTPFS